MSRKWRWVPARTGLTSCAAFPPARMRISIPAAACCEIGTDRETLEADYPEVSFLWLDTEDSEGEVFWLERDQLPE